MTDLIGASTGFLRERTRLLGEEPSNLHILPTRAKMEDTGTPDVPPNDQDQLDKPAKLIDSILNDLSHAILHANRVTDKDVIGDKDAVTYNAGHAQHHLAEAQHRATVLNDYLKQHPTDPKSYKTQIKALRKMGKKSVIDDPPKPLQS